MIGPTPLLDSFKRGEVDREARLLAAQGGLAPRAYEQLAILILLLDDADGEVSALAQKTLAAVPLAPLRGFLARSDVPAAMRDFFATRGILPGEAAAIDADDPLIVTADDEPLESVDGGAAAGDAEAERLSLVQQIGKMKFSDRLKAATKGSREMRAILVRDPNKMVASAVLSSPKLTDAEVESIARMANVSEDVLRIIASNRAWVKHYGVVVGLARNPKTPVATSLNLLSRLQERDVQMLSIDRNIPEPLRIAARKRVVENSSRR